ncbi:MAG: OstA-like protein [Ferruginibacter sp.]
MKPLSFYKIAFFLLILMLNAAVLPAQDTTRTIKIVGGNNMRQLEVDANNTLITLAGNAIVNQGNTTIYADSIAVNQATGIAECFGNVHINDADSVHTYAQYLKYLGGPRIAYLKRNVRLTDGKGTLITDDLEYNLATGVGSYQKGGKVINGNTVLTSTDATYYTDTKDVFFKKFVHLTDPENDIKADSLRYNTVRKEAYFIAPTTIKSKDGGTIKTKNGIYNLETGQAEFFDRTSVTDSNYSVTGGRLAYDKKTGVLQVQDRGKIVDSANRVIMIGDELYLNKTEKTFLGTRKPVMIIYRDNDSTYITADTLFSGVRKYDTASNKTVIKNDTLNKTAVVEVGAKQDSIRYFLAFHHVKIFNDSLQAVCDSLYYSTEDSVFRLFQNPVFWNANSQVSGDTMYLFTKNQQAKRLYVFNNSMVISRENESMYNQVGGRTLNAYFADGNIDYVRVKGSPAESIFYPQDEDSAFIGMNRSKGDVIDIYFVNKELNKVKFINDVDGTLFPLKQIPPDEKQLKGFLWQDKRRPKNKLEIFE